MLRTGVLPASPFLFRIWLDLFTDYDALERMRQEEDRLLQKEKALQLATLKIKEKYGKNAILKGTNFLEGATTRERNQWIGGHKA